MTKEVVDIIVAFEEAQRQGRQTALATVVHVEGSSYRRPGARMLVEENGKMTGAISGGCLEGDALRKALLAINQRQNKLVTYNTLDDDDVAVGVQLGCNGIVHILFEPVDPAQLNNPIALLEKSFLERKDAVLVTVFSLDRSFDSHPGTCLFFNGQKKYGKIEDQNLATQIEKDAKIVLASGSSMWKQYSHPGLMGFIELLTPPVSLVIVGAGNDALPLVDMASVLGWTITVVDGRATHANSQRFSKAQEIHVGKPRDIVSNIPIDEKTFFVLMTHNYNYDLEMLGLLLRQNCRYVGILGPRKKLDRMLEELCVQGNTISEKQRAMIYGPIGLDIGAESAEEIGLSVLAEIKAVLADREGSFLRDRIDFIHSRTSSHGDQTKINS